MGAGGIPGTVAARTYAMSLYGPHPLKFVARYLNL